MSQPGNRTNPISSPKKSSVTSQKKLRSLKQLPPKKKSLESSEKKINIQVQARKDYSSIIELITRKVPHALTSAMPSNLKPMLATLVDAPFNDPEWQFELKLDGYRALAYVNSGEAQIRSRNNNNFNKKFSAIHDALQNWKVNVVVDGEIVVLNEEGVPDFNSIQLWDKKKEGNLVFYLFDILWVEGLDMTQEPLYLRREILKQLIPESGIIRFSDHIDEIGKDFFEVARKNNLEGIIAKQKNAPYFTDSRSKTWLKIKIEERHEAVICGYTRKKDSDRLFSSLILGIYKKGTLHFIGQVGTGFTAVSQQELMQTMKPHTTHICPFGSLPPVKDKTVWLNPFLVGEVKYTELTAEGVMRHPSFQGLREDKSAFELNTEDALDSKLMVKARQEKEEVINTKNQSEQILKVDGHELKLTNLHKIYWPKEKISKGQLLQYYYTVADHMMPYMLDRPQSLNRFPNGIHGKSFYHKNMGGKVDKWLNTFKRFSDSNMEAKDFLICSNTASLIYMANLGCIEMNPWHSRATSPLYPDWCVIDLDPGEISFEKVIETAQVVHNILESLEIPSYPKTSGSTGIHIYIPLGAKYNYEQSRQLAELIVNLVHEELPEFTSLIRNPQKRTDKIYLDYLQNRPIQTICAPYSVRPKPQATVSAPLHWLEVKKGLKMADFTMKNMAERLAAEGDLFQGVLGKGIELNKVLKGLSSLI